MGNVWGRSAKDDSWVSSLSNWMDERSFTDISMYRELTRWGRAKITCFSLSRLILRCFETFKKLHQLNICMHELKKEIWVGDVSFCIFLDVEDALEWRFEKVQHLIVYLCKGEREKEGVAKDVWRKPENEARLVFQEESLVNKHWLNAAENGGVIIKYGWSYQI